MDNQASSELSPAAQASSAAAAALEDAGQSVYSRLGHEAQGFTNFSASVMPVDGRSGLNFLQMSHNDEAVVNTLDLTRSSVLSRVKSFSSIDLTGTLNNTIKLNWAAVAILSDAFEAVAPGVDSARMLVVSGNAGDAMQLVNLQAWSVGAVQSAEALSAAHGSVHQFLAGHLYKSYSLYGATVFVDEMMDVSDAPVRTDNRVTSQVFSIEQLFASQAHAVASDGSTAQRKNHVAQAEADGNGSLKGVAIVFAGTGGANGDITTTGHYELSKDGGVSWMSVGGDLSDAKAVYADKSALLRYVGADDAERIQPQSLMVRLIDESGLSGSASYGVASTGSTIDVSVHGESTAFGADALTLLARSSKRQPMPAEMPPLDGGVEDLEPVGVVGSPVSSLVGGGDAHGGRGIAITGLDQSQGTLYYSTNGGTTWTEVTRPLSDSNALFMRSDGDNRVYFKPAAGLMVRSVDALTIRSWDQSQETETIFFITTDDGLPIPVAEASLESNDARADESSVQETMTEGLTPAAPSDEWQNKPYDMSEAELAALGLAPGAVVQAQAAELVKDAAVAIESVVQAHDAGVYSLNYDLPLDLNRVISDKSSGVGAEPAAHRAQMDMRHDALEHVLSLSLADVLSLPTTNGIHQLMLTGDANDHLILTEGEWTNTGNVVTHEGHSYAVYSGTQDSSAQLLVDQQMLLMQQNS
ncbi:hypothetical protein GHT06_007469 [Daphnia sinensis]|uniref:Uncharacterized protein n=1 Tax=Daphnia sinensis TaxID=1820382 RepID=A0AAD5KDQ6_9CRUS|nr:hypothetical protein GHT06_007469 [Daphnia sinensis]